MNNLTAPLIAATQPNTVIRMGTISSTLVTGATTVFVTVGGSLIEAGILQPYFPVVGELVAVAKQDSSWLVLGALISENSPFDTGWVPFVLAVGFMQAGGGSVPSWRRVGNHVYWKGRVGPTSGTIANGTTILTVPSDIRPEDNPTASLGWAVARGATTGAVNAIRVDIVNNTGVVRTFDTTANPPTWVSLDGIQYFIA